jgi:hypothetical protein
MDNMRGRKFYLKRTVHHLKRKNIKCILLSVIFCINPAWREKENI